MIFLFHQTVHALSAQLCKTRRNIGVSRGKHHSHKTAFSIAFFAAFSAFFPHFSAFIPGDRIPPPPAHMSSHPNPQIPCPTLTHARAPACVYATPMPDTTPILMRVVRHLPRHVLHNTDVTLGFSNPPALSEYCCTFLRNMLLLRFQLRCDWAGHLPQAPDVVRFLRRTMCSNADM